VKTVAAKKLHWGRLVGYCLILCLAGCAPRIYETPYTPPPLPAKPAPAPAVSRQVFYVAVNHLNLRGCAGMDCPKISVLELNEIVEKLGEMDDWYEVAVKRDGRRGWVNSRYLSTEPVTPAVEAPPPPEVAPPPPSWVAPPPPVEKAPPAKPPVVEKPKPAKPGETPPSLKKKPEEAKPARPAKPGEAPAAPKKRPEEGKPAKPAKPTKPGEPAPAHKPAPPLEKPAPPVQKPAPPAKPSPPPTEPEQPKKIRIM
jgi:hypothetical protein